jgi:hypothetical protein
LKTRVFERVAHASGTAALVLFVWSGAHGENRDRAAVSATENSIERCLHWSGEEGDVSPQRAAQIDAGVQRDCPAANKRAVAALKLKSIDPALATGLLKLSDFGYLTLSDTDKNKLCNLAAIAFKADYARTRSEDLDFPSLCPAQAKKLYSH